MLEHGDGDGIKNEGARKSPQPERSAQALLETVLRQLPVAVAIAEAPSGRIILTNPIVEQLLGAPVGSGAEAIEDYARLTIFHPDGRPYQLQDLPLVRALRQGEVVSFEDVYYVTPTGQRLLVRCSASPVRGEGGNIVAAVAVFFEVSRAEVELRESKERFRLLVEDIKDYAIYLIDAEGRIATWNTGAQRILGYTAGEVLGRPQSLFYRQEDILLGTPDQALKVAAKKGRYETEGWKQRKDGLSFWAHVSYTALYNPNGQVRGYAKIVHDTTEHKLIEDALRESNRRLATTLESISDAFCSLDRDGSFVFVNPAAERLLATPRCELMGRQFFDVFPELKNTLFEREFEQARVKGVQLDFVERFPSRNAWFEVRAYPSGIGLSVYFRDVTAMRRGQVAQTLLAESGKRLTESLDYAETLEQITRLAVPTLADWCVALISRDRAAIGQFVIAHVDPREQECGRDAYRRFPPVLNDERGFAKVLRTGDSDLIPNISDELLQQIAQNAEHLAILRRIHLVSAMTVPLRARGHTLGAMLFLFNSPSRVYGPADLVLAEEVGRRAALAVDNALLYREAQTAIRAREDMVAIATHDLRGPVGTLKLRTQVLLRQARETPFRAELLPALLDGLCGMERQIDRLSHLVDSLLDISQIAANEIKLRLEPVDLAEVVREAVSRIPEQCADAGCTLTVDADTAIVGEWDRLRLEQVINNLVGNALKFGRGKPIDVTVRKVDHRAEVSVSDHGIGIPPEERQKIFERFKRGPGTDGHAGHGLGLYIVRRIVDALGGTIGVDSSPGAGATITVSLPIEDEAG